jgi:hypothetical protein
LIVFGLTRQGLEPAIYRNRSEHANHYTTYVVDEMMMHDDDNKHA